MCQQQVVRLSLHRRQVDVFGVEPLAHDLVAFGHHGDELIFGQRELRLLHCRQRPGRVPLHDLEGQECQPNLRRFGAEFDRLLQCRAGSTEQLLAVRVAQIGRGRDASQQLPCRQLAIGIVRVRFGRLLDHVGRFIQVPGVEQHLGVHLAQVSLAARSGQRFEQFLGPCVLPAVEQQTHMLQDGDSTRFAQLLGLFKMLERIGFLAID